MLCHALSISMKSSADFQRPRTSTCTLGSPARPKCGDNVFRQYSTVEAVFPRPTRRCGSRVCGLVRELIPADRPLPAEPDRRRRRDKSSAAELQAHPIRLVNFGKPPTISTKLIPALNTITSALSALMVSVLNSLKCKQQYRDRR